MKQVNETYTREEVDRLKAWFDAVALPETMQLDKATYIPSVPRTIEILFHQAYLYHDNPKLQGVLYLLERIKKKVEEEKTDKQS